MTGKPGPHIGKVVALAFTTVAAFACLAWLELTAITVVPVRRQVESGLLLAEPAKDAVANYYANSLKFPVDNADAQLSPAASSNDVASAKIVAGRVIVRFGDKADPILRGKVMVLVPTITDASTAATWMFRATWTCNSAAGSTVPTDLRPQACRP